MSTDKQIRLQVTRKELTGRNSAASSVVQHNHKAGAVPKYLKVRMVLRMIYDGDVDFDPGYDDGDNELSSTTTKLARCPSTSRWQPFNDAGDTGSAGLRKTIDLISLDLI